MRNIEERKNVEYIVEHEVCCVKSVIENKLPT